MSFQSSKNLSKSMANNSAYEISLSKKKLNQSVILAIGVWLMLALVMPFEFKSMIGDGDTEWHIAAGDIIRDAGALPTHDPWSFTAGDTEWVNVSWLWDVTFSKLYESGGWYFVTLANGLIYALIMAVIFLLCVLRSGQGVMPCIVLFAVSSILGPVARPLQLGLLFFIIAYALLELVNREKVARKWLWVLPPLTLLWANIHGSFILVLLLLGIYGLTTLIQKNSALFKRLFMVGALSLLASLANPYGLEVFYHILVNATADINKILVEWRPLELTWLNLLTHFYLPLFLLLLIIRPVAMSVSEKWCVFVFLLLGLTSQRSLALFVIVSAPIMASALAELAAVKGSAPKRAIWVQRICDRLAAFCQSPRTVMGGGLLMLIVPLAMATPLGADYYPTRENGPVTDLSKEVAFIQNHYPEITFYTDYSLGGSLIFQFRGEFPVFIDGRATTAYPKELAADYIAFHNREADWRERFAKRNIGGILMHSHDYNAARMRQMPGWQRVFEGDIAEIFIRAEHAVPASQ